MLVDYLVSKSIDALLNGFSNKDDIDNALRRALNSAKQNLPKAGTLYEAIVLQVNQDAIAEEIKCILLADAHPDAQRLAENLSKHQDRAVDTNDVGSFLRDLEIVIGKESLLSGGLIIKKQQEQSAQLLKLHKAFEARSEASIEHLGVAKAALKNFFKLLNEQHVPIEEWDHALRRLAEQYKELQQRTVQLDSEDPQIATLHLHAKQAIYAAEFEKAEALLDKAVTLDDAAAEKFKENYIKRKKSAADSQGIKAKSLLTRFALSQAIESYKLAITFAQQAGDEMKAAEFERGIGLAYRIIANNDQAISYYEKALNRHLVTGNEESTNVSALRNSIGNALVEKGDYDSAIRCFEQALAVDREVFGEMHPNVAGNWNDLGIAWKEKGNYDKAIGYYKKALAVDLQVFGAKHPAVARDWNNLGIACWNKGEYDKAMEYHEKALAVDRLVYGDEHPNVARDLGNLGNAWADKGQYDKAIEYYEQALSVHRQVFGDKHPRVATDWNNLGNTWKDKGQYDKAIWYLEQALAVDREVFGEMHPNVARDSNNLGNAWADKGQVDKAIEYYEQALAVVLNVLGDEHPNVGLCWNNLGEAWRKKGEFDKAIWYLEQALRVWSEKLGRDHPNTNKTRNNLQLAKKVVCKSGQDK